MTTCHTLSHTPPEQHPQSLSPYRPGLLSNKQLQPTEYITPHKELISTVVG